jgi:hypothetical protein
MNVVENAKEIRTLDNVVQYLTPKNKWKPFINSVVNKTAGFTLELSDIGKYIRVNSSSDITVIVPNLNFPIGSAISFEQTGTGTITLSGSSVTLNGGAVSAEQFNVMQIIKVGETEWTIIGGISA